jgi:hypothetical protein
MQERVPAPPEEDQQGRSSFLHRNQQVRSNCRIKELAAGW